MKTVFCALSVALILLNGCAKPRGTPGAMQDLRPGERPPLTSDEAGLWMQMERVERDLKNSGQLVSDPEITNYVREIVCRLAGDHCSDVRVYVVQTPHFNANMAPNGVMQVWTGLILRADNEAQLAYVLGHELGHYLRRHSLQLLQDARLKTNIAAFFSLLAAAAGHGYAGNLAQLIAVGSVFAFSRDSEREADDIGFELMAKTGYDPREAAKIWEALDKERRAGSDSSPLIFFATHPPTSERIETLKELAAKTYNPERLWVVGRDKLFAAMHGVRPALLRDELRRRDFARTEVLFDRLLTAEPASALIHFFKGELYRLRNQDEDEASAIESYERALSLGGAPRETSRALGLLFLRRGQKDRARLAFERYLADTPTAEDRAMILSYLEQLR